MMARDLNALGQFSRWKSAHKDTIIAGTIVPGSHCKEDSLESDPGEKWRTC